MVLLFGNSRRCYKSSHGWLLKLYFCYAKRYAKLWLFCGVHCDELCQTFSTIVGRWPCTVLANWWSAERYDWCIEEKRTFRQECQLFPARKDNCANNFQEKRVQIQIMILMATPSSIMLVKFLCYLQWILTLFTQKQISRDSSTVYIFDKLTPMVETLHFGRSVRFLFGNGNSGVWLANNFRSSTDVILSPVYGRNMLRTTDVFL